VVVPQAGVYAPLGTDMKRAWELWLERHGGKLGRLEVDTVVADEGEGPPASTCWSCDSGCFSRAIEARRASACWV
jgi:hypothetical protein